MNNLKRKPYLLVLGLSLLTGITSLSAQALTLDEAQEAALSYAPEVSASQAAKTSAQSLITSAGTLPDPRLSLNLQDYPVSGENAYQFNRSKRGISLMQEIPNSDKREAERQLAKANLSSVSAQNRFALLNVKREATLAWLTLYYLKEKSEVLQAQEKEIQLRIATTKSALAAGGPASDALMAQLEMNLINDAKDDLNRDARRAQAQLARWVGDEPSKQPITGNLPAWLNRNADYAGENFLEDQPEIQAAHAMAGVSEAELAMARADKIPDWGVELGVDRDGMGTNMAMLKFSFSLPLFSGSRQNPKIAAAYANLDKTRAEATARMADYQQQLAELKAEKETLQAQLERLRKVTWPLVDKQIELALAGLRSGKESANTVLILRNTRLQNQLRDFDLQSQLTAVNARIHFLTDRASYE